MSEEVPKLAPLKRCLQTEPDLSKILAYFLDHYAENDAFIGEGEAVEHPQLQTIVAQAAAQALNRDPKTRRPGAPAVEIVPCAMHIIKVGDHFFHGAGWMQGYMMAMFFFSDIAKGLCSISVPPGETKICRITLMQAPPPTAHGKN